jgi:hypothetical protein
MLEPTRIAWPTKTPVCLRIDEDRKGGARDTYLAPRNLDWRKHPSKTNWPMAPAEAGGRITEACFFAVESAEPDPHGPTHEHDRIRIGWPWTEADAPTHYLECYDTKGAPARYASESITARPASERDDERSVFTSVVIDGSGAAPVVALRCCHGRILQFHERFRHLLPMARLVNEPGVRITVEQPVLQSTIEVTSIGKPVTEPIRPAVDHWATLVNPTGAPLLKEFTFAHDKETTGTWNNELGISLCVGASMEISAGVGGIGATSSFHWELTADARRSWGGSSTEHQRVEDATTVTVPPESQMRVHIVVSREELDVPFSYVVHRIGLDGRALPDATDSGVYRKVETLDTRVEIDEFVSLVPERPAA